MGSKPQILQGAAKEYLSQIHLGQAKAHGVSQFELRPTGESEQEVPNCQVYGPFCQSGKYLTIRVLNLKIICVDLTLGGM